MLLIDIFIQTLKKNKHVALLSLVLFCTSAVGILDQILHCSISSYWVRPAFQGAGCVDSPLNFIFIKKFSMALAPAAHTLKLERHREDPHGPCARMTRKVMKRFILKKKVYCVVQSFIYVIDKECWVRVLKVLVLDIGK